MCQKTQIRDSVLAEFDSDLPVVFLWAISSLSLTQGDSDYEKGDTLLQSR
jgi:hypothetical protein